ALGRIGDPAGAAGVAKAEQSSDAFLHLIGAWGAARLSGGNVEKTTAVVKELIATLSDSQRFHRELAARALLELGAPPEMISAELDKVAKDLPPEKMELLIGAFASLGSRVVPRATELLKDPLRRERALRILARIGEDSAPAVPELVKLLQDADPKVRTESLFVLAAIGPKAEAAVAPATALLADPDRDVMLTAGYALGKIGPAAKSAMPALQKLLSSDDQMTHLTGVWALLKIDPKNQDLGKSAVPLLAAALKHSYDFVRGEAAITLGELGPLSASAVPALEAAAASDPSPAVRSAAAAAIKKIKGA
ncbi:MAG: HEAT repeat domain-containing protein, partial [Pirellulaceae bacterium]|nr:HEAT repeat domain-containing protein [Pirellulaceae bacterium]